MESTQTANTFDIGVVRAALDTDYEVLEELGRGGMAVVYRARERALDREVAIKVLPSILALDRDFVERFQREARTAGQLEHPNIVPIYRVGQAGHIIFFVMKLLRGQSLASVLRERGKVPAADVRRILIETASALGYAAKRGVVHRDIKPDNILLDSEGRCVVTDFGIAKTSTGPRTAAGTSMGTPRYMSPEHAQGIPVDGRSDIYSLGIVAYELLTGETPFTGDDPFAVLYKHINAPLPVPQLETDEERKVYAVIERMLAKSPDERYQHAYELIVALGGDAASTTLIAGGVSLLQATTVPTEIMVTGPLARIRRRLLTDRRIWAGAGALVVVAALGFAMRPRAQATASGATPPLGMAADSARLAGASTSVQMASTGSQIPATVAASSAAGTVTPSAGNPVDASAAAPAKKPPPPPFSRCPAKPKSFALLLDAIKSRPEGNRLLVAYDICGLPAGSPYHGSMTVRRLNQSRFSRILGGSVDPVTVELLGATMSPRSRVRKTIDIRPLPPGPYELALLVNAGTDRQKEVRRKFEIVEKKR